MADHARLAAAGLFLALTLAAVPALLPLSLAGAELGQRAEASPHPEASPPAAPVVRLRGGDLGGEDRGRDDRVAAAMEVDPADAPTGASAPAGVLQLAISETAPRSHAVAAGETLWKISQNAGIGVEALAAANHLTLGAVLHPGQVLVVPPLDPGSADLSEGDHEVARGETLWEISRQAHVGIVALAAANHLPLNALLRLGQRLVVPPAGTPDPVAAAPVPRRAVAVRAPARRVRLAFRFRPLAGIVGFFRQPSDGLITSRFGWRIHPIFGTPEFHTGVDIANRMGTPIRAAGGGMVRFVGWMGGYGRLVIVAHADGFETSYSHLSDMLVTLGQRVARGQVLGRMGSTGWSTGPHLFFEVRRHGVALDPMPFLQGRLTVAEAGPAPAFRSIEPRRAVARPRQAVVSVRPAALPAAPAMAPVAIPLPTAGQAPASNGDEHPTAAGQDAGDDSP